MVGHRGFVRVFAVPMLSVILAGCFWDRGFQEEITVFAASSLNGSLQEIGRLFEEASGHRIAYNFAGSNVLAQQIIASGEADIFLSADDRWMDYVEESGKIHPETRRDLLTNTLVAICSTDAKWGPVTGVSQLAELDFRILCVGDPDAVPAGRYARHWLISEEKNGSNIWEGLSSRLSPATDVKATLAQTLSRNDTVGIVYWTDYLDRKDAARMLLEGEELEALYPIAVTQVGMGKQSAGAFFRFIQSEIALDVFREYGFGIATMPEFNE